MLDNIRGSIYIRTAIKDDLTAVYGLMKQLSHHDFTREQFEDCFLYNLERRRVLVYEKDSYICGCIIFNIHYHLHFSRKSAEIVNLVVDKNARRRGIGKELLAYIERIAIENDCVCVEVASGKRREDAHRFYEREGYVCDHYKLTKELI